MLVFACIRDCSVCPFSCNRINPNRINVINRLPVSLTSSTQQVSEQIEENTNKSEILPMKNEKITDSEIKLEEKLPVLSDVQYHVEDAKNKAFNLWRKKK